MGRNVFAFGASALLGCVALAGCLTRGRPGGPAAAQGNVERTLGVLESIHIPVGICRPDVPPVAAVYFRPAFHIGWPRQYAYGPPSDADSSDDDESLCDLIFVVWPDGRILWSDDRVRGGPPYSLGQVKKEEVNDLLRRLSRSGAFEPSLFAHTIMGHCEGPSVCMVATDGTGAMDLSSDHEIFDETLLESLTDDRRVWARAKRFMFDLIDKATSVRRFPPARDSPADCSGRECEGNITGLAGLGIPPLPFPTAEGREINGPPTEDVGMFLPGGARCFWAYARGSVGWADVEWWLWRGDLPLG
jgi:hypothetical protein